MSLMYRFNLNSITLSIDFDLFVHFYWNQSTQLIKSCLNDYPKIQFRKCFFIQRFFFFILYKNTLKSVVSKKNAKKPMLCRTPKYVYKPVKVCIFFIVFVKVPIFTNRGHVSHFDNFVQLGNILNQEIIYLKTFKNLFFIYKLNLGKINLLLSYLLEFG